MSLDSLQRGIALLQEALSLSGEGKKVVGHIVLLVETDEGQKSIVRGIGSPTGIEELRGLWTATQLTQASFMERSQIETAGALQRTLEHIDRLLDKEQRRHH